MSLFSRLVLLGAKFVSFLLQVFGLGAGSTWPGEIVLRLRPNILSEFSKLNNKIVIVAGTNGKTTTSKLIKTILTPVGKLVIKNSSGANLENGVVSTLVNDINWRGYLLSDYFIWEVDEAAFSTVIINVKPQVIVLLNLFRDQLDRYGEVDSVVGKWSDALRILDSRNQNIKLVINGDDPQLAYLGSQYKGEVKYFGINNPDLFLPQIQHATDSIYCPKCGSRLTFGGVYFSHLGKYACGQCGFTHPKMVLTSKDVRSPLSGVYNLYNVMAATLTGQHFHVSIDESKKALSGFKPAFGRSEELVINGKKVKILLSKNPTGFNESLRTAINESGRNFLFVLNDRIPDGTDISWIWDVDFEMLAEINAEERGNQRGGTRIVVSGERAYDMGLRLKYALSLNQNSSASWRIKNENYGGNICNYEKYLTIELDLARAIEKSLNFLNTSKILYILPTYSAMLEVRKILVGRKIL